MTAFKIDESPLKETAALLRVHGFDVLTVGEQHLRGIGGLRRLLPMLDSESITQ